MSASGHPAAPSRPRPPEAPGPFPGAPDSRGRRTFLVSALAALAGTACGNASPPGLLSVPLPKLPAGPIDLTVAHALNPRFGRMSPQHLDLLLSEARRLAQAHFGVELRFAAAEEVPLARLFEGIPPRVVSSQQANIYDFKRGTGDRAKLLAAYETAVAESPSPLGELLAYAGPYLVAPPAARTPRAFAEALTATHLARLAQLAASPLADGQPALDASPYNEWILWDVLGYGHLRWDVIITNQLVASAEYGEVDVHSAIRGGIVLGTTSYSRQGRYGAYSYLCTHPFTATAPFIRKLRGDADYPPEEAAKLAAAVLVHELGHLLFHYGHPFGARACIMNPVPLLRAREWYANLDPAACRPGSLPAMQPGAARITYRNYE